MYICIVGVEIFLS